MSSASEPGLLYAVNPPEAGWALSQEDVPLASFEFGQPVTWQPGYRPPLVYIGHAPVPGSGNVQLFGVRYSLDRKEGGEPTTGFYMNYVVAERREGGGLRVHRLAQCRSVTYQTGQDTKDAVFASDLKKKERVALCLTHEPKWKPAGAQWPLLDGVPMLFVEQFGLPENEVTRQWLTFNACLFLFWREVDGHSVFKIMAQDIKYQSAEDHYRQEARRMARKQA